MGQSAAGSGQHLEERYFLQKVKLGQGSFGTVWRAVDRKTGDTVAIKQLEKASLPRRGVNRQDIEREIAMMKACSHDNITQLFDHFEDDTSIYLALEYCDGGDFGDKVKERGMAATEAEVADWTRQMCAAVSALHAKAICHRDIKPDNFMVAGGSMIKLSDFGLAIHCTGLLQVKCGTPAFMAPEQHKLPGKSEGYNFPADMWAVGVSMYMMMFGGKHPFLNDRGGLDDHLLLNGELEFKDSNASKVGMLDVFGLGSVRLRFSEDARALCKRMVEPNPNRRITADQACGTRWLQQAAAARQPSRPGGATPPMGSPDQRQRSAENTPPPRGPSGSPEQSPTNQPGARSRARTPTQADFRFNPGARSATPPMQQTDERHREELARVEKEKRELEDRKRELEEQQQRLDMREKRFEKQKTRELELTKELDVLEKQRRKMNEEIHELNVRQRDLKKAQTVASGLGVTPSPTGGAAAAASRLKAPAAGASPVIAARGKLLPVGATCRYESDTYGWMPATVQRYNDDDGTYDLDVRKHAVLSKISPASEAAAADAWPPGTMASYHSSSVKTWLPTVVLSYNESDDTYNLECRDHAEVDRIRARADDKPEESVSGRPSGRAGLSWKDRTQTEPTNGGYEASSSSRHTVYRPGDAGKTSVDRSPDGDGSRDHRYRGGQNMDETSSVIPSASVAASLPERYLSKGDRCEMAGHGLVVIESSGRDGRFTVKVDGGKTRQAWSEDMRAPKEQRYAWQCGTRVLYMSASVGKWIPAVVIKFNPSSCTYDLDVRQEADPEKVKPR